MCGRAVVWARREGVGVNVCIERLPLAQLRPFVECVWHTPPADDPTFSIVPDGCVDVCFVLAETAPRVLLFGTTTRTTHYELEPDAAYFGVRFRPGYAGLFVPERIAHLTDSQVEIPAFLGLSADEVLDAGAFEGRRSLLESSLVRALARDADRASRAVGLAVRTIDARHGDVRVRELAAVCQMSERQLERLFTERVGVAPKLYARIRRFRSVLAQLDDPADQGPPRLADLAAWFGYVDQSHLVRDFAAFAHALPRQA
jgi:methylphosphotriester-DNA--protein-cysteine methyltransferase